VILDVERRMNKRQVVAHTDIPFKQVDWGLTENLIGPEIFGEGGCEAPFLPEGAVVIKKKMSGTGYCLHLRVKVFQYGIEVRITDYNLHFPRANPLCGSPQSRYW
jgi:hypothetical protein